MDEQLLAQIEADHAENCPILHIHATDADTRRTHRAIRAEDDDDHCDVVELLAEVRRLRRGILEEVEDLVRFGDESNAIDRLRRLAEGKQG